MCRKVGKRGIHRFAVSIYDSVTEQAFDDIAAALRASPVRFPDSLWPLWRLAESLCTGLAIGVGFAMVHAFAG
ncbi:hypothetical protein CK219_27265 [Mesorhizobium sp. WSM4313]|nr:hypothetical protein CK219_27265 [Mesorhizobium sp. WSM4313]